jgi:hypothetical protein
MLNKVSFVIRESKKEHAIYWFEPPLIPRPAIAVPLHFRIERTKKWPTARELILAKLSNSSGVHAD